MRVTAAAAVVEDEEDEGEGEGEGDDEGEGEGEGADDEEEKKDEPPPEEEEKKELREKPAFSSVINMQSSAGNWKSESRDVLVSCIDDDDSFEDADVMQALN